MGSLMWFRRDLRLGDNPALNAAAANGPVTALFVLDPALRGPSGAPRLAFLDRCLRELDDDLRALGGQLIVRHGKPENVVPAVAKAVDANEVHIGADFGPYGSARDQRVSAALDGVAALVATGSSYAVAPGRVTKSDGNPYKVFTPFYRAWREHGWRSPAGQLPATEWRTDAKSDAIPVEPQLPSALTLPAAGEAAAMEAWHRFRDRFLGDYADQRDRPALDATSHLSAYLKYGCIHPRTLLAELGPQHETFRKELAWREFYAAVLHFWPASAREYFQPEMASMTYDTGAAADAKFIAWTQGRTGYPIVDAGMRQLLAEGWMHNRVRMIVASFLVKDLHLEWTVGARHFMRHLVDGDLASNQHGWQWTAGTGTDAAPYFRVFNPMTQGQKFDPSGEYIRRYVPELRDVAGKAIHQPWTLPDGVPTGYVEPIVDHAAERIEALDRYAAIRNA